MAVAVLSLTLCCNTFRVFDFCKYLSPVDIGAVLRVWCDSVSKMTSRYPEACGMRRESYGWFPVEVSREGALLQNPVTGRSRRHVRTQFGTGQKTAQRSRCDVATTKKKQKCRSEHRKNLEINPLSRRTPGEVSRRRRARGRNLNNMTAEL